MNNNALPQAEVRVDASHRLRTVQRVEMQGGDADPEAGGMRPHDLDQFAGVEKIAAGLTAVGRWITAEGEDVLDLVVRVYVEQRGDVGPCVPHACEVGHAREQLLAVQADDD